MPGTHIILNIEKILPKDVEKDDKIKYGFLKHECFYEIRTIEENNIQFVISKYPGYPVSTYENDQEGMFFLIEGLIYNVEKTQVIENLKNIVNSYRQNGNILELNNIITKWDGDFVITIHDKNNHKIFIFTDYFGRLPLYYYASEKTLLISRETKFITHHLYDIEYDEIGMLEYVQKGYQLGNRTIFKDIKRLLMGESIIIDLSLNKLIVKEVFKYTFDVDYQYLNTKKKSLIKLKELYTESLKNRTSTLINDGYNIIADLSGGYDSRAIWNGININNIKCKFITFEYIQDESIIAKKLFQLYNNENKYYKISFENKYDPSKETELLYKTEGLVESWTTQICYNDSLQCKKLFAEKTARIMGLGGEFSRHPYKVLYKNLYNSILTGIIPSLNYELCAYLLGTNPNNYKDYLKTYIKSYPEKTKEGQLKRYYYEYYRNHVVHAGEERSRMHFWTVAPLMGSEYMRYIFNGTKLNWMSFSYFIKFLKLIDSRSLEVPIYNSNIKLKSYSNIYLYDQKYLITQKVNKLKNYLKKNKIIYQLVKKFYINKSTIEYYSDDYKKELDNLNIMELITSNSMRLLRYKTLMIYKEIISSKITVNS